MNKYFKIFSLHWQDAFQSRSRSVVWFLLSLAGPLILLLFWRGAFQNTKTIGGWNFSSFVTYYFLLIIAGALLVSHIEEGVALDDIRDDH